MLEFLSLLWTPHGNCIFAIAPLALAAIMAGANYAKSEFSDKPRADKQRRAEAEATRWSPWTRIVGKPVADPDSLNALIQGGFMGYNLGENIQGADEAKAFRNDQMLQNAQDRELQRSLWLSLMRSQNPNQYGPAYN